MSVSTERPAPGLVMLVRFESGDRQQHQVVGRAACMIAFLIAYQERLNGAQRGTLEFHFDGAALKPAVHEFFASMNTAGA